MPITLKDGFIYFLREKDVLSGEISDYVKIGKTDRNRPVGNRIDEHQTGNPRLISAHESFRVVSVDTVETHLHHAFAEHRVSGEWFRLDPLGLNTAIEEGKKINSSVVDVQDELTSAAQATSMESKQPERQATEDEHELLRIATQVGEELKHLELRQACVEWDLKARMGAAKGIDGVLAITSVTRQRSFDEKSLQTKAPDLYAKFLIEKKDLKRSFSLAKRPRDAVTLDPKLTIKLKKFKNQVLEASDGRTESALPRNEHLSNLHDQYLKSLGEISRLRIMKDLLEAKIKAACGAAEGIHSVCKWSRRFRTLEKFNQKEFKKIHPELFDQFLFPLPPPELRISVALMRSY